MRPALEERMLGLYVGVDPGADGAVAAVERYRTDSGATGLRLLRVELARAHRVEDQPAATAAAMVRRALGMDDLTVRAVAVEWPGLRARQSGGDKLAVSAGAAMGAALSLCRGAELHTPRPEAWLADLACLADGDDDVKAVHVARLLDSVPGAEPHLIPPRGRVAHDGAADAALLALWAAGLRGPGASSRRWTLSVGVEPRVVGATGDEVYVVGPNGEIEPFAKRVRWERPTVAMLRMVAARGRWAGDRGWAAASLAARNWFASLGTAGDEAFKAWGG
jgi:hypothetical protein